MNIQQKDITFTLIGSCLPINVPSEVEKVCYKDRLIDRRDNSPMEMDGYSLYLALKAYEIRYSSDLYDEKTEIVSALLERLHQCGGFWSHGKWTANKEEIHLRFTSAAIRLLVEAYIDGIIKDTFLIKRLLYNHLKYSEKLDMGEWFLHDSFESEIHNLHYPSHFSKNNQWGSSYRNLLVLNTHIDTLNTLLFTLEIINLNDDFKEQLIEGIKSLNYVLNKKKDLRSNIFSMLDHHIRKMLFITYNNNSSPEQIFRYLLLKYFSIIRKQLKSLMAFYVFADGYLERDICLGGTCFDYHIVNLWDISKFINLSEKYISSSQITIKLGDVADNAINYAVTSKYKYFLLNLCTEHGGPIELCESMIARFQHIPVNKKWIHFYCYIRRRVPPSPAILGYDPLIIPEATRKETHELQEQLIMNENLDCIPVKDNLLLIINYGKGNARVRNKSAHKPLLQFKDGSIHKADELSIKPCESILLTNSLIKSRSF